MGKPRTAEEVLEDLLDGAPPTPELIDELRRMPAEGLCVEFKSGRLFDNEKAAKHEIRRCVSGFGNTAGGILVLGVSDGIDAASGQRAVDGCPRVGGDPAAWLGRVLQDLGPHFSPPFRVGTAEYTTGMVVLIAVPRAPMLVPFRDGQELKYAIRAEDQTVDLPHVLAGDFMLGRRARPRFAVEVKGVEPQLQPDGTYHHACEIILENTSLVKATGVYVLLVSYRAGGSKAVRLFPSSIRTYLDLSAPVPRWTSPNGVQAFVLHLKRREVEGGIVLPLSVSAPKDHVGFMLPPVIGPDLSRAAVAVMADECMPDWWELTLQRPNGNPPNGGVWTIERSRLPRVGFDGC